MGQQKTLGSWYEAQVLYDLRELTGFVGGDGLCDLFEAVNPYRNPCPSGGLWLPTEWLEQNPVGQKAVHLLMSPLRDVLPDIQRYTGALADFPPLDLTLFEALGALMQALDAEEEGL